MNIELQEIAVRDLVAGYEDKGDEGVVGYGGRTVPANCQMLCKDCNRRKGAK